MDTILTVDIGSTSMRAIQHDEKGAVLHQCSRETIPKYLAGERVELDAEKFVDTLYSLLKESYQSGRENDYTPVAISVTAQRSSVVPVDVKGEPLAPFIMWHDKRTVPICREFELQEDRVYELTGLRITPVLSAVKMTWLRRECPEIYKQTEKMLGVQDVAIHALCGEFVTDHSLASNTNLLNIRTREWDQELMDIFSVDQAHLCDLIPPGAICGNSTTKLNQLTGIPQGTLIITAGGDQQCAALGLGIFTKGKLKCTTGTGSYLIAHTDEPIIDEQKRFLCKIGAIPGSYNLEAGLLTTGTVYRWFLAQFYGGNSMDAEIDNINREVLASPAGANGVLLLPHFEGSGAPHWNPKDTGAFYHLKLSTTRADMARAVMEGIVMEMGDNINLFREKLGEISSICISGGMTKFVPYNQLQADIYGSEVTLYGNREATSLGAWISAAVTCGLYDSYEEAFRIVQPAGSEKIYFPNGALNHFYTGLNSKRKKLYQAQRSIED